MFALSVLGNIETITRHSGRGSAISVDVDALFKRIHSPETERVVIIYLPLCQWKVR